MAVQYSTGCRTAKLQDGLDELFDGGVFEVRSGTQPSSADDAPSGTLLATISIPTPSFGTPSAGQVSKTGSWQTTNADNTGTAAWFRMRTAADSGVSSTTDIRLDGTLTLSGGGGDVIMDALSIVAGGTVTVNTLTFVEPAS